MRIREKQGFDASRITCSIVRRIKSMDQGSRDCAAKGRCPHGKDGNASAEGEMKIETVCSVMPRLGLGHHDSKKHQIAC